MSSKITYFKTERFIKEGMFDQTGSKCTIKGLVFRKGDTLAHHEVEQVIKSCNQYRDRDINTIIVKDENDLTIWIEETLTSSKLQNSKHSDMETPSQVDPRSLPTKTVIKKYRGQEYEETVVDWAAMQQINQSKPRRKYRGQYID